MIFSIVILILVLGVAFFHYIQGFFSATVSAMLTVIAAVLAVSYHEPLAEKLLLNHFPNQAHALALLALFALIYLLLRVLFDNVVQGNLRLPVTADKIGAGAMGLVAGMFALGVFAIAGQELPFATGMFGYTRYKVKEDQPFGTPARGRFKDLVIYEQLSAPTYEDANRSGLLLPADDLVVGTVRRLSDGGSLAGAQSLSAVHPDWLQELFGQRLGIQTGINRVAINNAGRTDVSLKGIYSLESIGTVVDTDFKKLRQATAPPAGPLKSAPGQLLVSVRLTFSKGDAKDNRLRTGPAAVRLVTHSGDSFANNYPIGTLDGPDTLAWNAIDDFMFIEVSKPVDFVFRLNADGFATGGEKGQKVVAGDFLEVKRLARVDLSGATIEKGLKDWGGTGVFRKELSLEATKAGQRTSAPAPAPAPAPSPTPAPAPGAGSSEADVKALQVKLVGKWEKADARAPQDTLEFKADGTTESTFMIAGKSTSGSGTWKALRAEGNQLIISLTSGGSERSNVPVIIGDGTITLTDNRNQPYTMRRAR